MKLKLLLILLILIVGCQSHESALKSAISDWSTKAGNTTLHGLQFLTIELKREAGQWPSSKMDYIQAFGDSVEILFSDFSVLDFKKLNDTLVVLYKLENPKKLSKFFMEFERIEQYSDTAKVKFVSNYGKGNIKGKYKPDEGKIYFYEANASNFSIIHEFKGGVSNNKITTAQQ